jgi:serine protease Do
MSALVLAACVLLLTPKPADAQQMQMMEPGQAEVIRGLLPTVVNITSYVGATSSSGTSTAGASNSANTAEQVTTEKGSGLIIDPSGVILTNHHVIAGAYDIRVMFSDGQRAPGRVLAIAPITDLALVKVDTGHPLAAVRWADSDKIQVGDTVFAIGNPLGIGLSVSSGIVSALNRNLEDTPYDDFIQTDASINHGNSGGPLFNRSGEVIGVDTAIISPTTGSVGIGFAIPANDARFIADLLMRNGHARPAYLGVKLTEVTPDIAAALGMTQPTGSIIDRVHAGGPAAAAGLQVGDVILRYGEQTPSDGRALLRDIAHSPIGRPVTIDLLHAGQKKTLQATPVAWPETGMRFGDAPRDAPRQVMLVPPNLGLSLHVLTADLRAKYGLQIRQVGVAIDGVAAGTDASERGLVPGDVILRVGDADVSSPQEVQVAVDAARAQHKVFILALVLPKISENPGPSWMALRVVQRAGRGDQRAVP